MVFKLFEKLFQGLILSIFGFFLFAFAAVAQEVDDPAVISWMQNLTGETGRSTDAAIDADVGTIEADVLEVWFTDNDVYIGANSVPSYNVGPFSAGLTDIGAQNNVWEIGRTPPSSAAMMQQETGLGAIGIFTNGVQLFNWSDGTSYENEDVWNYNAPAVRPLDDNLGHPAPANKMPKAQVFAHTHPNESDPFHTHGSDLKTNAGGAYHLHTDSPGLREQLGDDGSRHSSLIGYAWDDVPIYGPYGYDVPLDSGSGVRRMETSWRNRSITDRSTLTTGPIANPDLHGPAIDSENPLGTFAEDLEYAAGSGDLDEHNGRTCVTPEFPGGVYAYFVTIDENGDPAWPYTVGPEYYALPNGTNLGPNGGNATIPGNATQYIPTVLEATPTPSPTAMATSTPTNTVAGATSTQTPTEMSTNTVTNTIPRATATPSPTEMFTSTATQSSPEATATPSQTEVSTHTPTQPSPPGTRTPSPTGPSTHTPTQSSPEATATPSPSAMSTQTPTQSSPEATATPSPSEMSTGTPINTIPGPTRTPSPIGMVTHTPTNTSEIEPADCNRNGDDRVDGADVLMLLRSGSPADVDFLYLARCWFERLN